MFKYDNISFLVILLFFPDLGIFTNSSSVIFSDLIIFLTSGDKKPAFLGFVNEGISIGVSSIIFSLVSLEIFSSKVKSLSFSLIFTLLMVSVFSDSSSSVSIIAIVSPTLIISFISKHFSIKIPFFSEGTSESTLSVAISTIASSKSIVSPISLSHARLM